MATLVFRVVLALVPILALGGGVALAYGASWSDWYTAHFRPIEQPVPFSHKQHVAGLGLDCRYCHTTVEVSPSAGLPPTEVCATCHQQMWMHAPMLAPVRESWNNQTPLQWNRVYDLPDYVYFDHSIHVAKGVGCSTCHGDVSAMPLTERAVTLQMRWCLDCHTAPEKYLRPTGEIFNGSWQPTAEQLDHGGALVGLYHIQKQQLTNCSVCHR